MALPNPRSAGGDSPEAHRTVGTSSDPAPLVLKTSARPSSVTEARRRVAEYAGSCGADRDDVELAVAEAVGNAVVHAFEGRDDGVITVRGEIDGPDYLVVEIADTGFGITTIARDPRAGFGLPIIGALADSVEIQSGHEGTRLLLRFPRAGQEREGR